MKNTEETTEFFTPHLGLTIAPYVEAAIAGNITRAIKQGVHHVGRYEWACMVLQKAPPRRLLDIACGAGYGSYMLAKALPKTAVVGADYDRRAVVHANKNYKLPNLSFIQGDIVQWTAAKGLLGKFDAIISFDTIEHILHRDIALLNMARNLTDGGRLLLSTPVKRSNLLNPAWEHHKIEYGRRDLHDLLRHFFARVLYPSHPDFVGSEVFDLINISPVKYIDRMNPLICSNPIRIK